MPTRTSATHPIRVDFLPREILGLDGRLGMTFAPGKKAQGIDGRWDRDLTVDLARLRQAFATDVLVSLIEEHEFEQLDIRRLPAASEDAGILLDRFPIPDGGVPAAPAEFAVLVERTVRCLRAGKTVVVHCRGGLGRTGLLAAACLRFLGVEAVRAIEVVRAARPGTVENATQEAFVRNLKPPAPSTVAPDRAPTLSRFRGCLLGGALGDSLGEPVEFIHSAKEIARRFGVRAPVKLGYAHGPFIVTAARRRVLARQHGEEHRHMRERQGVSSSGSSAARSAGEGS